MIDYLFVVAVLSGLFGGLIVAWEVYLRLRLPAWDLPPTLLTLALIALAIAFYTPGEPIVWLSLKCFGVMSGMAWLVFAGIQSIAND